MGRSQVLRNRTRGRPGQGGRGRGRGGDGDGRGGGRGRGDSRRRRGGGGDPSKLGDNSFRYARGGAAGAGRSAGGNDYEDALGDWDQNFFPGAGGASEFLSDVAGADDDFLGGSATTTSDSGEWTPAKMVALDGLLRQIPVAERLGLPAHIGRHLEEMYGSDKGRKMTLAEMREESRRHKAMSGLAEASKEEIPTKQNASVEDPDVDAKPVDNGKATDKDGAREASDNEEDEEDLDAWLDDMIA